MAEDRLSLAIPIDVARAFDSTVSQAQIGADTFQSSTDDTDLLASMIEDAEDEWRVMTDDTMQISRVGVSGQRTTFEQATYKISGHKLTKATFTGVTTEYLPDEDYIMLEQSNILPFDSSAGDAVYFYKGLDETGDGWEEITDDENDVWQILDYREGRFVFQPTRLREEYFDTFGSAFGSVPSALKHLRFAISYRYGALGGSRGRATSTELGAGLTDTETGTANDQMNIVERGVRGTTATSHDSGDRVQYTPPAIRKAVASRAGMQLIGSSQYQDWLPDTESSLDKGDVYDNLESVWTTTVDAMSG